MLKTKKVMENSLGNDGIGWIGYIIVKQWTDATTIIERTKQIHETNSGGHVGKTTYKGLDIAVDRI